MSSRTPSANSKPSSRKEGEVTGEAGRLAKVLGIREIPGRMGTATEVPREGIFEFQGYRIVFLATRMRQLLFEWEEEEKKKKNYKIRSPFSCLLMCGSIAIDRMCQSFSIRRCFSSCLATLFNATGRSEVSAPQGRNNKPISTYIQNMDTPIVTEEKK